MCLGLPGRVLDTTPGSDLAQVDVAGVIREIDLGLVDGPFAPGDYVLIHSGFALERMTSQDALAALDVLAAGSASGRDQPAPDRSTR